MTSATAIVSPIARPSPMRIAAVMPLRLCGNTAARIISQRVAPSASAASFCDSGTVANTSRVIAVMIGVIMIARMRPAVMNACPADRVAAKSVPRTGRPRRGCCESW